MISKEKTGSPPSTRTGRAGYQAEVQMGFYLRRAYAEASDVYVINDLRIVLGAEAAQIDHLVIHRYGFVVVESKSVTGSMEVNTQLEFVRNYGRRRTGMKSPIQQARMQAELLCKLLNKNKKSLRRRVLLGLRQGRFGDQRFEILVAVSDQGEIRRKGAAPGELVKADTVVDRIASIIERQKSNNTQDPLAPFTDNEMEAIVNFLLSNDKPLGQLETTSQTIELSRPESTTSSDALQRQTPEPPNNKTKHSCSKCGSDTLKILYGKYGYYFKCRTCQGNTKIDVTCPDCGEKSRIRKSGDDFTRICGQCLREAPFHSNAC